MHIYRKYRVTGSAQLQDVQSCRKCGVAGTIVFPKVKVCILKSAGVVVRRNFIKFKWRIFNVQKGMPVFFNFHEACYALDELLIIGSL